MLPAILITGGAKRIGAVLARSFAAAGWHVVIHYGRSATEAEALQSRFDALVIRGDQNVIDRATSM